LADLLTVDTLDTFNELVERFSHVVVEFGAPWCGPCKRLEPHFRAAAEKDTHGDTIWVRVDVDKDEGFLDEFAIQSVPTLIYFYNGDRQKNLQARTVLGLHKEVDEARAGML